jgi:hypothetical protein
LAKATFGLDFFDWYGLLPISAFEMNQAINNHPFTPLADHIAKQAIYRSIKIIQFESVRKKLIKMPKQVESSLKASLYFIVNFA